MSETQPEIKIGISNLNLPPREIALGGVGRMYQLLDFIDPERQLLTHGFELTPTRAVMATSRNLAERTQDGLFYGSVHQSWGQGMVEGLRALPSRNMARIGGGFLLAEQHASLAGLKKLSEITGRSVPAVVFANHEHNGSPVDFKAYGFEWVGTQPSPEMDEVLNAGADLNALGASYTARSIDKTIWDNHHAIRPRKGHSKLAPNLDDVVEAVKRTGKPIGAFHASAGRYDTAEDPDTQQYTADDLKGLINGNITATRMGEVLMSGFEINRPEYAILEVPYSSVAEFAKNEQAFYDLTFEMAGNLQNFLDGIDRPN